MKSKKLRRRALLTSIMSLVLCCAMLVGTTFAWFTDSVTSANNIIKSGNLDVELYYQVEGQSGWTKVTKDSNIFKENALWEPGHTEVVKLKVVNEGTLALKYQLGVNVASETESTNVKDEPLKLSDHIKFGIVDGAQTYTREEAVAEVERTANALNVVYNSGTVKLEAKNDTDSDEKIVTMVVYMPTTVGNEANHAKDAKVPTINLGINLFATQVEAEMDSFGSDYDKDAWHPEMSVGSAADLQAAIDAGETNIVLTNDIELTEAIVIPAPATTTYSLRSAFNGIIIDLNGKNITIEAAYDDAKATASSAVVNNGSLKLTGNGTIKAANNYTVRNYGTMVIDGVTVENGVMNYGDLTVESGEISNSRSGKHAIYGNNAKLTINGGTFHNGNPGNATIFSYAGEVLINGGEFTIADGTATQGWTSCLLDAQGNAKFTINGGFVNGEIRDYNKNTLVYGGTFSHSSVKNFVAAGYKAVETSNGWMVIPESSNYVTSSEELVEAIKTTADGGTILMAAREFAVRFTNDTTFNADNLTFKGMEGTKLSVSSSEVWYGRVQGDNVVFENIEFTSSVGATGKATYNNCTFSGDWTICASGSNAETYINNCTINGCLNTSVDFSSGDAYVKDSTIAKAEYSGSATMNFENCKIGELIVWNMNTNLVNTTVETMDLSHVTTAVIMIDGYKYLADGLGVDSNGVYGVSSGKGLVALNAMMAERKAGKGFKVELLADINMTGEVWTTVDSHVDGGCYISEFDGNGHTISNLTINGQAMFSRFAGSGDVVIKDVTFDKANVNSNGMINTSILTVQSYQNVLLDNVDVTNSTITGGYKVAPLIATVYNESSTSITATLKNCDVSNTTVTATVYDFCTTGMVAFVREKGDNDKVVFENCTVSKVTLVAPDDSYKAHAWIYVNDADTDDKFDEAAGVTVTGCVFQNP